MAFSLTRWDTGKLTRSQFHTVVENNKTCLLPSDWLTVRFLALKQSRQHVINARRPLNARHWMLSITVTWHSVRVTSLHGRTTTLVTRLLTDSCWNCRNLMTTTMMMTVVMTGDAAEATGDDVPVCATKVAVTQRVADGIDRTVDVAQPVAYIDNTQPWIIALKHPASVSTNDS